MSYRNPTATIDQKYAILNQSLNNYYSGIKQKFQTLASDRKAANEKLKKEKELEDKKLQNKLDSRMSSFDRGYDKAMSNASKYIFKQQDKADQDIYNDLKENLTIVRNALKNQLKNQDLTEDEIKDLKNRASLDINKISKVMQNIAVAEQQYNEAMSKDMNEVGRLLSGEKNELIKAIRDFENGSVNLKNKSYKPGEDYVLGSADLSLIGSGDGSTIDYMVEDLVNQDFVESKEDVFNTVQDVTLKQDEFNKELRRLISKDSEELAKQVVKKGKLVDEDKPIGVAVPTPNAEVNWKQYQDYFNTSEGMKFIEKLIPKGEEKKYFRNYADDSLFEWNKIDKEAETEFDKLATRENLIVAMINAAKEDEVIQKIIEEKQLKAGGGDISFGDDPLELLPKLK
tara:strand:- start:3251 stop:4447 length:1197 start_codon:yes stop_codon:yes gene_type:complete